MELQGLYNVYVVNAENKVVTREVTAGPKVDSLWLIEKGLKPGEKVVYEGLQKVRDGATVKPVAVDLNAAKQKKK
jgi:membrane fusion protein (multidrug efflux system)